MLQLDLMPLIDKATEIDRNAKQLQDDIDYETKSLMFSKTDELLIIGDMFAQDTRQFCLIGFQVKAIEIEGDAILETYYQFENKAGEVTEIHTDEFLRRINRKQWIPTAPQDCIFAVNSMIFGTPEFNEALKWECEYHE